MTPLERLGLEVAAFQLLGSRTKAATLCTLIHSGGASVGWEALAKARPWMEDLDQPAARNVVKTRICLLRESLDDVGLGQPIVTHEGRGYSLPEPARSRVIARLVEMAT